MIDLQLDHPLIRLRFLPIIFKHSYSLFASDLIHHSHIHCHLLNSYIVRHYRSSSFYTIGPPPSTPSVLLLLHHRSSSFYTIGPPRSTPSVLLVLHHRSSSFYTISPPPSTPSVLLFLHHRSSIRKRQKPHRGATVKHIDLLLSLRIKIMLI